MPEQKTPAPVEIQSLAAALFSGLPGTPRVIDWSDDDDCLWFKVKGEHIAPGQPPEILYEASRSLYLNRQEAIHGCMVINEDWQCKGLARIVMRNALNVYPQHGIKRIRITANIGQLG